MTEATAGLRKALARGAGVSKMTPEELLAQMSDDQKAALAATLAPAAASAAAPAAAGDMPKKGEGEGDDDDADMVDGEKKSKSKDKDGDEYMEGDEAEAGAKASGGRDVALAVMASEHFAGREKLAATLLANDKLSADEIIAILSASGTTATDPEDAARADMKAALAAAGKSGIEANDGGTVTPGAAASVWDKSYAKLGLVKPAS